MLFTLRVVLALGAVLELGTLAAPAPARPNIILIVADDLGWADLGCFGSTFHRTPRLNRLASEGMRFTDAYAAAPVCSPSRAAILTGKHPARLHLTDWLPGRGDRQDQKLARPAIRQHLALEEITLAESLKGGGYATAHIGKWHLGGEGFGPRQQGFDVNIAGDHTGTPLSYFAPFRNQDRLMPGLEQAEPGEYLTDRLTLEAEKFIELNRERPFFLHLAHYAVHIPLRAKTNLVSGYSAAVPGSRQTNAIYAAMLESLDESIGRIVKKLEALGLTGNTLLVFTSDNGGLSVAEGPNTPATSNHPLRSGKGYLHEGGIRVPLIVCWPKVVPAGVVCTTPVISMDLFPTLLAAAGVDADRGSDGIDLTPLLRGGGEVRRETLFWHYPHYSNQGRVRGAPPGAGPGAAMRAGDWKLIQHFEDGAHELYNLAHDRAESRNLADQMPEKVLELGKRLHEWQNRIRVQWPMYNSEFRAPPVGQADDGTVLLHSRTAVIRGRQVRYEPQPHKNTVGYWTRLEDWVSWDFEIQKPGEFSVEVLQGCGKGSGGSEVEVSAGGQRLVMRVEDTGDFQKFVARTIGTLRLQSPGRYTLAVKPQSKPGAAVMDLRQVRLLPVAP